MSRYELSLLPGQPPTLEVAVGWDAPMSTYYASVFNTEGSEEGAEVLWIGASAHEIADPARVIDAVREYAEIPDGLEAQLTRDAAAEGHRFVGRPGTAIATEISLAGADADQAGRILADVYREPPGREEIRGPELKAQPCALPCRRHRAIHNWPPYPQGGMLTVAARVGSPSGCRDDR